MMRFFSLVLIGLFICTNLCALEMTQYNFDNLDVIDKVLKDKYPQFKGFSGSKDNMKVYGIDEETINNEIEKMDVPSLVANKPEKLVRKALIKKLKEMGFTKEEMLGWNLKDSDSI